MTERTPQPTVLRRYARPREERPTTRPADDPIPFAESDAAIAQSGLSPGSRALLRGLLRVGSVCSFPGGGIGIEYGSLLKTAARPDYLALHVQEAAVHLNEQQTDLLLVPGMSGYPVGAMYALASRAPAVLLKKTRIDEANPDAYPAGAFVIPSYTGDGDVVMHADPAAVADIVEAVLQRKLAESRGHETVDIELRVAGADDIIDKATMSQAVSESAVIIGESALESAVTRHRTQTGDARTIAFRVRVVAWVTPLIKGYNHPYEHLHETLGISPFAGIDLAAVYRQPSAIEVHGVGTFAFASSSGPEQPD